MPTATHGDAPSEPTAEHCEAIRSAVARYCRGVDRCDTATMQSAYWPDAIDDHGVFVGNAHEFCEMVVRSHRRFVATMHCIMNHHIELDVDMLHATGEVYNISYLRRDAEDGSPWLDTWYGRYLDRYERRLVDGRHEWRIIHRVCVHEWTTSAPITATMPIDTERFRQGAADRFTA